jgi:hypothetical protein
MIVSMMIGDAGFVISTNAAIESAVMMAYSRPLGDV